jgi:hypothetical protein
MGVFRIFKSQRLVHVHCFFQFTMKKSILDIQLMNLPRSGCSNAENCANSSWFYNWDKSFSTVNANLLTCTITYKSGFMPLKSPSKVPYRSLGQRSSMLPCLKVVQLLIKMSDTESMLYINCNE